MGPRFLLAAVALASAALGAAPGFAETSYDAPAPARQAHESGGLKTAIFAGGCFWGVEAVFSHTKGVTSAISGYEGGKSSTADYRTVSSGTTGHREAVKITYDPSVVRYDQLLQIFFSVIADPTLKNNQGPDHGPQYDAALFPASKEQRAVAVSYLSQMKRSGVWSKPIVTSIDTPGKFYPAETYHQDFAKKNTNHGYIRAWDAPKVEALKARFPGLYKSTFTTG